MSTTITIDGTARVYEESQLARYKSRLATPGTGLGACIIASSTNLSEGGESHLLKSVSPAGTGQRASCTTRDVVTRSDGSIGEVTVVTNVYHDDTHAEDLVRAGAIITGQANMLVADSNKVLADMANLGIVKV